MLGRTLQRFADIAYHLRYMREAARQYRKLHANRLRASPGDRRRALAYARDVLGGWYFAPWLINYSAVRGSFVEGWIADNFYGGVIVPQANRPLSLSGAKTFSARVLPAGVLPDIGYHIDGRFYDTDYRRLSAEEAAATLFADEPTIVAKPEYSQSGIGVELIQRADWNPAVFGGGEQRTVFQRYLPQHPVFDAYCRGGATIRVTTVREPAGTYRVRAAYARLSAGDEPTVRSVVAHRVPLDPDSGAAVDASMPQTWRRVEQHPVSGAIFRELQVPAYQRAAELACRLHAGVPQYLCIGWDLLIDPAERPWVLEWNTRHNGIGFSEAMTGPNFRGLNWESYRPDQTGIYGPPIGR
jgi:hypothetical protein